MSAAAASAAVLPRPRTKSVGGASRRRLRSVPVQAGPVVALELGNPLQLSKSMRVRLLAAVRALVSAPALAGASDGARLASVVLTAKAKVRDDYQTSIWAAELGRWLGVSQSTVAHTVLPELRAAGFLGSNVAVNGLGHATGLECWVIPMYRAQKAGDRRHPLALSRSELAVLLSLCEVLFGPGWVPKDKPVVPAGLLAGRTGRGAATDRLGLLLMVLTTGSAGWLQLCPGSVDASRGRPAATVARLLGCTAAAGAKVLRRLQEHGVAEVVRKETCSGLRAQSRVRLVPVAKAHGVAVREARQVAKSVFSDLAGTASGDLESGETGEPLVATGVEGAGQGEAARSAELAAPAQHHALHTSGVTAGGSLTLLGGFSGEGRGADGRRPERAGVREDQALDGEDGAASSASPVAGDGPLRGEKPKTPSVGKRVGQRGTGAGAGTDGWPQALGGGKAQQRRASLPVDLRLRVALRPVVWLWERLSGWQRDQVEATAKAELARLEGLLALPGAAPRLLADRLTDRLAETGGEAMVTGPYGWLIRRGLVQRQACTDRRCDDGIRLDTGGECENCGNVIHFRRARRAKVAAQIDREVPGLSDEERRRVLEERLREQAVIEAEDLVWRREQARVEQARRDAARVAARERAERERQAAAAADAVRQAQACADCGQAQAAGLCEVCGHRRQTRELLQEAARTEAAWTAVDFSSPRQLTAARDRALTSLRREADQAGQDLLDALGDRYAEDPQAAAACAAYAVKTRAGELLDEARRTALAALARSPEAEAEARQAYGAEQARRPYDCYLTDPQADAPAREAAQRARERTARCLLKTRLESQCTAADARQHPPGDAGMQASWARRLQQMATRPLPDDAPAGG